MSHWIQTEVNIVCPHLRMFKFRIYRSLLCHDWVMSTLIKYESWEPCGWSESSSLSPLERLSAVVVTTGEERKEQGLGVCGGCSSGQQGGRAGREQHGRNIVFAPAMCFRSTVLIPWPFSRSQNTVKKYSLLLGNLWMPLDVEWK